MKRKESVSAAAYTYTVLLQPEPEGDTTPTSLVDRVSVTATDDAPRLPAMLPGDVVRALARAGSSVHRIRGSHHHLRNPDRPDARPVVPMHRGDLPPGTFLDLL
jgi:predicted RNA binding protein YcfA (HicA-like mRNA interferase family)